MRTETIGLGIYGLAATFLGLMVWEARKAMTMTWVPVPRTAKEFTAISKELRAKGVATQPERSSWNYSKAYHPWWKKIQTANWVGKVPVVEVPDEGPREKEEPPKPPIKPLAEIIQPRLLLGAPGDTAYIQVLYLDPNVEVPDGPTTGDLPAGPRDSVPNPDLGGGLAIYQDLRIGDSLYKPYDLVRFEGVTKDGLGTIFSRPDPEGKGRRIRETLHLGQFSISDESFGDLPEGFGAGGSSGSASPSPKARRGGKWKDPGEVTKRLEGNVWMVSRKDRDRFQDRYDEVLRETGAEDFVDWWRDPKNPGRRIKVTGISFRKVPERLRSFGVKAGDILIEVNGTPVKGKSSAIRTGREQWRRGVRTFELTFLSNGRRVVRTFQAPPDRR